MFIVTALNTLLFICDASSLHQSTSSRRVGTRPGLSIPVSSALGKCLPCCEHLIRICGSREGVSAPKDLDSHVFRSQVLLAFNEVK